MDWSATGGVAEDERAGAAWIVGVVLQDLAMAERLDELHISDPALPDSHPGVVAHGPLISRSRDTKGINVQRLRHRLVDTTWGGAFKKGLGEEQHEEFRRQMMEMIEATIANNRDSVQSR